MLTEYPFQLDFFVRAFLVVLMLGMALPTLGVFMILRRLSLLTDSLSHVALGGVAVGALLQSTLAGGLTLMWPGMLIALGGLTLVWPGVDVEVTPVYVGLWVTMLASLLMEELRLRRWLPGDLLLATFLYGSLAVALVLLNIAGGLNSTLLDYLFGSVFGVSAGDVGLTAGVMGALLLFIAVFSREMGQMAMGEDLARLGGVQVRSINRMFAMLAGAAVIVAMLAVGVLLAGALMLVPAMLVLRRRQRGLTRTLVLASAAGLALAAVGMFLAYYLDQPPSGTVVLAGLAALLISELEMAWRRRGGAGRGRVAGKA